MLSKNSPLVLVLRSLSSRKSIASMVPIGLRMRRRMYIFLSCCGSVSSSSLRVPERVMSIAGKVRLSATLRSRMSSELPVPLNSSKMTSSMLEQALCLLDYHLGDLHMARGRFVEGRGDHLAFHRALHVGDFLRPLVDQQHDQEAFRVVRRD